MMPEKNRSKIFALIGIVISLFILLENQIKVDQSENATQINVATFNVTHLARSIFRNINAEIAEKQDQVFGIDCESMPKDMKIFCTVTSRHGSVIYIYKNHTGIDLKEFALAATFMDNNVLVTQFNGLDQFQSELQINSISEIFIDPYKRLNDI